MEADSDRGLVITGKRARGDAAFEEDGQAAARVPLGVNRDHQDGKGQQRSE
jgi:hypothetical protein